MSQILFQSLPVGNKFSYLGETFMKLDGKFTWFNAVNCDNPRDYVRFKPKEVVEKV